MSPDAPSPISVCFSQTGQFHTESDSACEDRLVAIEEKGILFYGLADGQSGKRHCTDGAAAVLNAIAAYFEAETVNVLVEHTYLDELQYHLVRIIRQTLHSLSQTWQCDLTEFASTLVIVVIDPESRNYLCIHLGDGVVLGVREDRTPFILSHPENGITRQYTWLTTSPNCMHHLRVTRGSIGPIARLILLTDGATALFREGQIAWSARTCICDLDDPVRIPALVCQSHPWDDASGIIVDCRDINAENPTICDKFSSFRVDRQDFA